jgi:hypothetical protein
MTRVGARPSRKTWWWPRPVSGALTVAALACSAVALTGCRGAAESSAAAVEPACANPLESELGLPTLDLPATFTTTAGQLRFRVTGMDPDALIPIDTTTVFLGKGGTLPHRDPQRREWPDNAAYRVRVSLDDEGYVDVPAGTYWAVSSAGGRIYAAACPGTTVTDVAAVSP